MTPPATAPVEVEPDEERLLLAAARADADADAADAFELDAIAAEVCTADVVNGCEWQGGESASSLVC